MLFGSFGGIGLFEGMFFLVFVLVIGTFLVTFVRGIRTWNQNNNSPRLTVRAVVVAKRTNVTHHHHNHGAGAGMHMTTNTSYYVTFEVESGDRMELHMTGSEYGMLAEGDYGQLSFQGTRYLGFVRA